VFRVVPLELSQESGTVESQLGDMVSESGVKRDSWWLIIREGDLPFLVFLASWMVMGISATRQYAWCAFDGLVKRAGKRGNGARDGAEQATRGYGGEVYVAVVFLPSSARSSRRHACRIEMSMDEFRSMANTYLYGK